MRKRGGLDNGCKETGTPQGLRAVWWFDMGTTFKVQESLRVNGGGIPHALGTMERDIDLTEAEARWLVYALADRLGLDVFDRPVVIGAESRGLPVPESARRSS